MKQNEKFELLKLAIEKLQETNLEMIESSQYSKEYLQGKIDLGSNLLELIKDLEEIYK